MSVRSLRPSVIATICAVLAAALLGVSASALDVPPVPTDIPIVDQTNTLTSEQKTALADKIASEREKSSNQIAVVMISSLEDESLEGYSLRIAREWGVGTGENNNGVLLLVAKEDRRLRIEVGTGLEGALTDAQSGRIIRGDIAPLFQQGKYYEGLDAGVTSIIAAINGEYVASPTKARDAASFPWEFIVVFGFMALSWLGSILGRTKSWWAGGVIGGVSGGVIGFFISSLMGAVIGLAALGALGLLFDKAVSANYRSHARRGERPSWWAGGGFLGGGGRGGSSGGFGGFGGGGFGGGGASGGW